MRIILINKVFQFNLKKIILQVSYSFFKHHKNLVLIHKYNKLLLIKNFQSKLT